MRKPLLFLLLISYTTLIVAQTEKNEFDKTSDSDPAATAILENLRAKYESYKTMEVDFSLVIEIPEHSEEKQKGHLIQEGDKFRLKLETQTIVSDSKTLWLYLKNREEVQINDAEEDEGELLSPNQLLRFYESEEFAYALTNEFVEDNRVVQQIEFKPLDPDSEYSKMRLTVDKKSKDAIRIKTFSKDGARYTLLLNSLTSNKTYPASTFIFPKTECPNCHWEDLRI